MELAHYSCTSLSLRFTFFKFFVENYTQSSIGAISWDEWKYMKETRSKEKKDLTIQPKIHHIYYTMKTPALTGSNLLIPDWQKPQTKWVIWAAYKCWSEQRKVILFIWWDSLKLWPSTDKEHGWEPKQLRDKRIKWGLLAAQMSGDEGVEHLVIDGQRCWFHVLQHLTAHNQPIHQMINWSVNPSINWSVNPSMNWSANLSINWSANSFLVKLSIILSANPSINCNSSNTVCVHDTPAFDVPTYQVWLQKFECFRYLLDKAQAHGAEGQADR